MPGTNLTREEAATRAALVTVVHPRRRASTSPRVRHDLRDATAPSGSPAAEPGAETFLDFIGGSVESVTRQRHRARPGDALRDMPDHACPAWPPSNDARRRRHRRHTRTPARACTASSTRSTTRSTSTRQFEVPDSRRMFPSSSSPTSRPTFAFTVTAPAHWQVVSNSPTPEPTPARRGRARRGPSRTTARISCYITALVAGPYDVVRDDGADPHAARCRSASSAAARCSSTSTPTTSST